VRVLFVQHQADCPPGLVGDRLIELGARLDVADPMSPLPDPAGYQLLVPLGSEHSAADESVPYLRAEWELLAGAVRADVPVFGICFGAQLLCRVLGGSVTKVATGPEVDWMKIEVDGPDPVGAGRGCPGTTTRCSRRRAARSPGARPAIRRTSSAGTSACSSTRRPPRRRPRPGRWVTRPPSPGSDWTRSSWWRGCGRMPRTPSAGRRAGRLGAGQDRPGAVSGKPGQRD